MLCLCLELFLNSENIFKLISMGKGDIKTRRGKLFNGSFGRTRPKPGKIRAEKNKSSKKSQ